MRAFCGSPSHSTLNRFLEQKVLRFPTSQWFFNQRSFPLCRSLEYPLTSPSNRLHLWWYKPQCGSSVLECSSGYFFIGTPATSKGLGASHYRGGILPNFDKAIRSQPSIAINNIFPWGGKGGGGFFRPPSPSQS